MTQFGRQPGRGVRSMAMEAAREALQDAGVEAREVGRIFLGNAAAGVVTQQEMIRGQVALRGSELAGIPLMNIENACASGSSAFKLAWESVASGACEVALAIGVEQLNHEDRSRPFNALRGSTDIEEIGESEPGVVAANSVLMDVYAGEAREYLESSDASVDDFARVAVKNRRHASENPLAHFRTPQTIEEVLGARTIVEPLTLSMCSPLTDGAAAIVVVSPERAARVPAPVRVRGCEMAAGTGRGSSPVADAVGAVYRSSGAGPDDLDVLELHDAAAPAELIQYAEVGICEEGEAHHLVRRGETELGGRLPVNTSGGLMSRGHPLGATGTSQLVEIVTQLRRRAGGRQVPDARVGMAVNGGGWLGGAYATAVATVLEREGGAAGRQAGEPGPSPVDI
ncbi:MAG TPA: thiolase family protein [Solirubrobacteraceae bacterium]|nr:thiolase family protein [Solirubrobacteraceae bacterium]